MLVNNAGTGLAGPFLTDAPDDLSHLNAVNIDGLTRLTRAALPDMIARQRGGILNMASLGAYVPGPNQAAYYASKSYVLSLTEALASEVSGQGVRVAAMAPGPVNTTFHRDMGAEASFYRLLLPSLTAGTRGPKRLSRLHNGAPRHRARDFKQCHVRCVEASSTLPDRADRLLAAEARRNVNAR